MSSSEVAQSFHLERHALCPDKFLNERMEGRLQRRLKKGKHLPPPLILRGLLSEQEILEIYRFVDEVRDGSEMAEGGVHEIVGHPGGSGEGIRDDDSDENGGGDDGTGDPEDEEGPEPGSDAWLAEQMRLTAQLSAAHYEASDNDNEGPDDDAEATEGPRTASWFRLSESHEKLFLHHGGPMRDGVWRTFGQVCSSVLVKLLAAMNNSSLVDGTWRVADTHFTERPRLNVRCIEFHQYTAGGGLTDPGHIDVGSILTLSVQLSHPEAPDHGGRFTTTDATGAVSAHELARGDAVIFCSEQVHNVQTLSCGTRNSLVIELWTDSENKVDRHH